MCETERASVRARKAETGIATDSVVECVVEFLWLAKCLVGGGTENTGELLVSRRSLPQLKLVSVLA